MRSIGKVKIKKLNIIIEEETRGFFGSNLMVSEVTEKIKARIPEEWFDIWESAWSEIENLIDDGITAQIYRK